MALIDPTASTSWQEAAAISGSNDNNLQAQIGGLASGSPLPAQTAATMSNTTRLYVYLGSESGYHSGHLYYYNGSVWTDSGIVYQATQIADGSVTPQKVSFATRSSKNLLPIPDAAYSGNGVTATVSSGIVTLNGTASADTFFDILTGLSVTAGSYYLYAFNSSNSTVEIRLMNTGTVVMGTSASAAHAVTYGIIASTISSARITLKIPSGTSLSNFEISPMLSTAPVGAFEPYVTYVYTGDVKYPDSSIPVQALDTNVITPSHNLFYPSAVISGYFVDYSSGGLIALSGYNASGYIPITPGGTFTLGSDVPQVIEQFAYYDSNFAYISGWAASSTYTPHTYTAPSNAAYVRLSVRNANLNTLQLTLGSVIYPYEACGSYKVDGAQIRHATVPKSALAFPAVTKIRVVVAADGSGDYTSVKAAVDYLNSIAPYDGAELIIMPGTYDIYADLGGDAYAASIADVAETAKTDMLGLNIPDNTHIIGYGMPTLNCICPDSAATNGFARGVSIFVLKYNCDIDGIRGVVRNSRYVIHDEGQGLNYYRRRVRNCYFEHQGTVQGQGFWAAQVAYGAGTGKGSNYEFDNCVFKSLTIPWSIHNNYNTIGGVYAFKSCQFWGGIDQWGMRFGTYGTGYTQGQIYLEGCASTGDIRTVSEPDETQYSAGGFTIMTGTQYYDLTAKAFKTYQGNGVWA